MCGDQTHPVWEKKLPWRKAYTLCNVTRPDLWCVCVCVCVKPAAVLLTQVRCAAGGSIPQALFIRHLQWGAPLSVLVIVRAALGHLGGIHSPRVECYLEERIQRGLLQHLWLKGIFASRVRAFKRIFCWFFFFYIHIYLKECTKKCHESKKKVRTKKKSFCMSCDVWTTHVHAWMGKTLDSSPKIEGKESQAKMCFHVTFSCQLTCERFRKCAFLL